MAIGALPLRVTPTDWRALLVSSTEVLRWQAEDRGVKFRVELGPALPAPISLDPDKVAWAVTTLVGTALRYVRSGSSRMPGGAIDVTTSFDAAAGEVTVKVEDDGPGIPADKLPSLFRSDGDRPHATGLALTMIRDVVIAHGGRVEVQSSTDPFGHGTTVRLTFPAR
jgi:signal transduction histidine kinase